MMTRIEVDKKVFENRITQIFKGIGYTLYFAAWIGLINFIIVVSSGIGFKGEAGLMLGIASIMCLGAYHLTMGITDEKTALHKINEKLHLFGWKSDAKYGSES
ncbi:MAG: hypothetical protein ACHQW9_00075 [Nitrososphaerales archaeon]